MVDNSALSSASPDPTQNLDYLVENYLRMKDAIARAEKKFDEQIKPVKQLMEQAKDQIQGILDSTGQDSAKTAHGTAYKTTKKSATIEDGGEFRRHVIGTESWDLVDWRANTPAVEAFLNEAKELPPGIKYNTFTTVNIKRA